MALDTGSWPLYCPALRQYVVVLYKWGAVMKHNTLMGFLVGVLLAFPLASVASAQITTATIVGTITDSSGGILPGATVTARNVDTGFTRTVPSNSVGAYRLEFLPIGTYVVQVTFTGYETSSRSGIVLRVNDTAH